MVVGAMHNHTIPTWPHPSLFPLLSERQATFSCPIFSMVPILLGNMGASQAGGSLVKRILAKTIQEPRVENMMHGKSSI